jgi:hypothetical protein
MKVTKLLIILAVLLALLAFTGCNGDSDATDAGADPYVGGDVGIEAEFEPFGTRGDSGLYEIWEGETFPIEVRLENNGEYEVQPGQVTVTLKGINLANYQNIVPDGVLSNEEIIERVTPINEDGGEETLDFTPGEDALYTVEISGNAYDQPIFAEVAFEYQTFASSPQICFKEDLQDERICDVDEVKTVYSSGAPVQVVRAEEKRAGTGKIAVEFDIEDKHHADDATTVAKPGSEFDTRFDELEYEVQPAADWECKSGGKVNAARLSDDGTATIRCVLKEPMEEDTLFMSELKLILKYRYRYLINDAIRIKTEDT